MKYHCEDTIAAISTPVGSGGIGIIRISGDLAIEKANKIFRGINKRATETDTVARMSSHTIKYGNIVDPDTGEYIDECLISVMKGPHSYTKEDIVEINCHGGYAVMRKILSILFKMDIRPAEPGEFTKRAFMNGRIDLSKAEAVMDIINAKTEAGRKTAVMQLSGRLTREISNIREKLKLCLAEIEVALDYPEYEMDEDTGSSAMKLLTETQKTLTELSDTFYQGRILKDGIKVSISGIPNVGKSSLLNLLTGYDRAIVTDIEGTTRDTIEESIEYDGIPIILTDTAGLRKTADLVEKIGVDRSYEAIKNSDIVIFMADISEKTRALQSKKLLDEIKEKFKEKNIITVLNKCDIEAAETAEIFSADSVKVSVKEETGIKVLLQKIKELMKIESIEGNQTVITSERHKVLLDRASDALKKAQESYSANLPLDCISYDIWECGKFLGEITGESIEDDVMETIFSKFCLGK